MEELGFSLPDKLILPATYMLIGNMLATKIQVKQSSTLIEFDPSQYGLLSDKVKDMLKKIRHPTPELSMSRDVSYSFTLDQNLLNALIMELSAV